MLCVCKCMLLLTPLLVIFFILLLPLYCIFPIVTSMSYMRYYYLQIYIVHTFIQQENTLMHLTCFSQLKRSIVRTEISPHTHIKFQHSQSFTHAFVLTSIPKEFSC